jgi:hypothetical protein
MDPRPIDFIGAAVLTVVLVALVVVLLVNNIPAVEA